VPEDEDEEDGGGAKGDDEDELELLESDRGLPLFVAVRRGPGLGLLSSPGFLVTNSRNSMLGLLRATFFPFSTGVTCAG